MEFFFVFFLKPISLYVKVGYEYYMTMRALKDNISLRMLHSPPNARHQEVEKILLLRNFYGKMNTK